MATTAVVSSASAASVRFRSAVLKVQTNSKRQAEEAQTPVDLLIAEAVKAEAPLHAAMRQLVESVHGPHELALGAGPEMSGTPFVPHAQPTTRYSLSADSVAHAILIPTRRRLAPCAHPNGDVPASGDDCQCGSVPNCGAANYCIAAASVACSAGSLDARVSSSGSTMGKLIWPALQWVAVVRRD